MKFTDIGTIGQSTSLRLSDLAVLKSDLPNRSPFECLLEEQHRLFYKHQIVFVSWDKP